MNDIFETSTVASGAGLSRRWQQENDAQYQEKSERTERWRAADAIDEDQDTNTSQGSQPP
jgi:hypothetical protein